MLWFEGIREAYDWLHVSNLFKKNQHKQRNLSKPYSLQITALIELGKKRQIRLNSCFYGAHSWVKMGDTQLFPWGVGKSGEEGGAENGLCAKEQTVFLRIVNALF